MSEKGFQFRTAAFGGFRKEDVMAYLEQSAKAHMEKMGALQRELKQAKAKGDEGEEQSAALAEEVAKLREEQDRLTAELSLAEARKAEAEKLAQELREELEHLRPAAEAYETVKSRTAGIELEAHGRAQAIEEEGRRKAKQMQEQVIRWLEKLCAAYGQLRGDIDATLNHALREMSRTHQNLQDFAGDFTAHDQAMAELRKLMEGGESAKQPPEPLSLDDTPSEQ